MIMLSYSSKQTQEFKIGRASKTELNWICL